MDRIVELIQGLLPMLEVRRHKASKPGMLVITAQHAGKCKRGTMLIESDPLDESACLLLAKDMAAMMKLEFGRDGIAL